MHNEIKIHARYFSLNDATKLALNEIIPTNIQSIFKARTSRAERRICSLGGRVLNYIYEYLYMYFRAKKSETFKDLQG